MQAMNAPIITLDGPGGSGKGTLSSKLAEKYRWNLLDSGALYRLTALAAQNHGVEIDQEQPVALIAEHLDVRFEQSGKAVRIYLENDDVTSAIREERVGRNASIVASFQKVRDALIRRQRAFAQAPGLIADGRDMGTVVFPEAELKIYLTASAEERAKRRVVQLKAANIPDVQYEEVLNEIVARDERDMTREAAPLKPAEDAILLDTTQLSINEAVEAIDRLVLERDLIRP